MFEIINNITLEKNITANINNNNVNTIQDQFLSTPIFNELNKYLISKEIEFVNVLTEEKKDNNKNITSTNFIIHSLLNIFNSKDIYLNSNNFDSLKNNKVKKKKIDSYNKNLLKKIIFFKNVKYFKDKEVNKKSKILNVKPLPFQSSKNKNQFFPVNALNNMNITKNLHIINSNNQLDQKKNNFFNIDTDTSKFIKNGKNIIFDTDIKSYKNNFFTLKNANKTDNFMCEINFLKKSEKKEHCKSTIEPLIFYDSQNSIEWKKLINQKILLSISNKDNQAEIHLKPDCLGAIYIKINIKNDQAILNFISDRNEVRSFLEN